MDGTVALIITDGGVTVDNQRRLELLQRKLAVYALYILNDGLLVDHPGRVRQQVRIRVMYANPPTEELKALSVFPPDNEAPVRTPVTFEYFPR